MLGALVAVAWAAEPEPPPRQLEFGVRTGPAYYAPFQFWTVGGEVRVRLWEGLRVVGAFEAWGVKRIPPPEVQLDNSVYSEWNWIQPASLGAIWQFEAGPVEPWVGADAIVTQHYADRKGARWTGGGRARFGANWFFVDHLGVGLDGAVGGWAGKGWDQLEPTAHDAGPVVQASTALLVGL